MALFTFAAIRRSQAWHVIITDKALIKNNRLRKPKINNYWRNLRFSKQPNTAKLTVSRFDMSSNDKIKDSGPKNTKEEEMKQNKRWKSTGKHFSQTSRHVTTS
jgi:hypothetical protein